MKLIVCVCLAVIFFVPTCFAGDYLIGRGDVLEVAVWGVPEMSRSVVVRPDGKITLPAVGDVLADQITPEELSKKIATAMKTYIKQPVVTVSVQEIRNNRVYITGGNLSRVFNMTNQTTLLKLLSELGDFSTSDLRRAYLSRNGKQLPTDFYALYFDGDLSQDIDLQAEDIIFIPGNENNIVYVLGAVVNPQPVHYTEGMRVLDAILGAGGFTEFAKVGAVIIVKKDNKKIKINLNKVQKDNNVENNVTVAPGDYIIVEESMF